jgi:hypothetical protein
LKVSKLLAGINNQMGANNSKQEVKEASSKDKRPKVEVKVETQLATGQDSSREAGLVSSRTEPRERQVTNDVRTTVHQTAPQIDIAGPDASHSQMSDGISRKSDVNAYRVDFNGNTTTTFRLSKQGEVVHVSEKKPVKESQSVAKQIKAAEDALLKKVEESYVKKVEYVELAEKVKELSEALRKLNDRLAVVEKEKSAFVPLREQVNMNFHDQGYQMNDRQSESEDLIKMMKEQLKKRKPDSSVLDNMRRKYKEYKVTAQQSHNANDEN